MARVAIITNSEINNDPRPFRVLSALRKTHDVFCVGRGGGIQCCDEYVTLPEPLSRRAPVRNRLIKTARFVRTSLGDYETVLNNDGRRRGIASTLHDIRADVAWVHDLELLPFALRAAHVRRVIFDAREYYPAQHEESMWWRIAESGLVRHTVKRYIPTADAVATVSKGLAAQYNADCGIECEHLPSYPVYSELVPSLGTPDRITLIYHGKAHENRKCELMFPLMDNLGHKYHLTMMLVGGRSDYVKKLHDLARSRSNVDIGEPVTMPEIARATNNYDIGLCAIYPTTYNLKHCLPNKLFEMVQARLAIVAWPTPDVAEIITQHDVGVVSDDFSTNSLATAIRSLSHDRIQYFKRNSNRVARQLSFETTRKSIVDLTESVADAA